jgi:uncharacterized protein
VPPGRGIFLAVTRRMHPDLCRFVSDAVYDSRLEAEPGNARQRLLLEDGADPEALLPAGLRFVAVEHAGCAQKSEEEAERLRATYERLLAQRWTDRHGDEHPLTPADILVVSPYNMQVNLLQGVLPPGARVGTVDKFQGQEAPVVLVSMATSSGEDLPRNIEFLYSRNRLNVAISRARCLAVVYACPRLLEIPCHTVDQMRLVNTLCWAKAYADSLSRRPSARLAATGSEISRRAHPARPMARVFRGVNPGQGDFRDERRPAGPQPLLRGRIRQGRRKRWIEVGVLFPAPAATG